MTPPQVGEGPEGPGPELSFGEGRISGVLSVVLAALSLGAVLCFRFPALLTTPELRAVYPMELVRGLLFACLLLSLGLGLLSALLARRLLLPAIGIGLAGAAVLLGGAWVEVAGPVPRSPHLGLDWFVLDLLVLALLFVPLERWLPRRPRQRVFRVGWPTDLAHFAASHLGVQAIALLALAPAALWLRLAPSGGWQDRVAAQPVALQLAAIVGLADAVQYGVHRAFHRVPRLWRFHAIHHSSRELDWLAGSRLHLVDILATRAAVLLVLEVAGFAPGALTAYLVFVSFHAVWIHANLRSRLPGLRHLIVTPQFHHWHHAQEAEGLDVNFAVHLPVIDRIFGTHRLPGERWPAATGIEGDPVPDGWLQQLAWPFTRGGPSGAG